MNECCSICYSSFCSDTWWLQITKQLIRFGLLMLVSNAEVFLGTQRSKCAPNAFGQVSTVRTRVRFKESKFGCRAIHCIENGPQIDLQEDQSSVEMKFRKRSIIERFHSLFANNVEAAQPSSRRRLDTLLSKCCYGIGPLLVDIIIYEEIVCHSSCHYIYLVCFKHRKYYFNCNICISM